MLDRHEQQALFDAAFDAFWRDPKLLERMMAELLPKISGRGDRRRQAALATGSPRRSPPQPPRDAAAPARQPDDAGRVRDQRSRSPTASACSAPTSRSMTAAEFELAQEARRGGAAAVRAGAPAPPRGERRRGADRPARDDARAWRASRRRWCRASAAAAQRAADDRRPARHLRARWTATRASAALRARPDAALPQGPHAHLRHAPHQHHARAAPPRPRPRRSTLASAQVQDWKGGTRIASCLDDFNRHWARRLLGANAALLLVTDGLDRDEHGELTRAAAQLRLFARQIVWLNPLLRFERLRAARRRRACAAALRRPLPAGPQPGEPRRPRRRRCNRRRPRRR